MSATNDDWIVRAENVGKCFKIYGSPWRRLADWVVPGGRRFHVPFWALKDISFEVKRGSFLGVIGQNGAGKSTLLKILSGVLSPTTGSFQLRGRLLSMLELGLDFHPHLTGRENLFRCVEQLAFPAGYLEERLPQIVEFAELGPFLDRPVRLYSTGMTSRLAFSLFAFLDCDVLVLDEVLAVGDLFFRQKCYARLEELIKRNTTIIFVSHQMDAIQQYCDQVLLLDKGGLVYKGEARQAIRQFMQIRSGWAGYWAKMEVEREEAASHCVSAGSDLHWPEDSVFAQFAVPADQPASLCRFAICSREGKTGTLFEQGDTVSFYAEFEVNEDLERPVVRLIITNQFNVLIHSKSSAQYLVPMPEKVCKGQRIRMCHSLEMKLAPGEYVVGATLMARDMSKNSSHGLNEDTTMKFERGNARAGYLILTPKQTGGFPETHWGICDLPGSCQVQCLEQACAFPGEQVAHGTSAS